MEAAVGAAAAAAAGAVGLEAAGGASAAPANGHRWGGGREPCTCRPPPPPRCNGSVLAFQRTGRIAFPLRLSFLRDFLHRRRERMEESLSIS